MIMITTFLLILVLPISTVAAAQQVYTTIIIAISSLIPPSIFSLDYDNCVTIDCYKERIKAKCEEDHLTTDTPIWLDCGRILKCLDFRMSLTYCASRGNDFSGNNNSNDDCCRLTNVVLEPCKDKDWIKNGTLPAPPECARMILS